MLDDNHSSSHDIDPDATTGEYPVLVEAPPSTANGSVATVAANGLGVTPAPRELLALGADSERVTTSLAHLDNEIAHLHHRWLQIDGQFRAKSALEENLRREILVQGTRADELASRLEQRDTTIKTLEEALTGQRSQIATLTADAGQRKTELQQTLAALAAGVAENAELKTALAAAQRDIGRLNDSLARQQAAQAELAERGNAMLDEKAQLNLKIQELETYIDGRSADWAGLNAQLSDYRGTLLRLEKTLAAKQTSIDSGEEERRGLERRIADLERQNAELTGRRNEREAAYAGVQGKLAEQIQVNEHLRAEAAKHAGGETRLLAQTEEDQKTIVTLRTSLAERDDTLAAMQAELAAKSTSAAEATTTADALAKRVTDLEHAANQSAQQLTEMLTALRTRDAHATTLQQQIDSQRSDLAQSRTLSEQQAQQVNALTDELHAKQTALDLLQRNIQRIETLGTAIANLEQRMGTAAALPAATAGERAPADAGGELLPSETFLGKAANGSRQSGRALVGSVSGVNVVFPLAKSEVTIGRGKMTDIRIPSHFISRVHARISTRGIATTIEDLGSKNGIFVNSRRIKRCVLRDGDIVSLASEFELRFVDAAD
jgi:chromosome segregation ATPase